MGGENVRAVVWNEPVRTGNCLVKRDRSWVGMDRLLFAVLSSRNPGDALGASPTDHGFPPAFQPGYVDLPIPAANQFHDSEL